MGRTGDSRVTTAVALTLAVACGGGDAGAPRYAVQARVGTYNDGSGRLGLTLLATVRDEGGSGPAAALPVSVVGDAAVALETEYAAAGGGSYLAVWRPDVAPRAGGYEVVVTDGGATLSAAATLALTTLAPPEATLTADGERIAWPAVADAAAYLCRVHSGGALQLEQASAAPGCDVSSLPAGAYRASVVALTAPLDGIAASAATAPALPTRFDVSETTLAFVRGEPATSSTALHAAGGAYDDGLGDRSLAIWLSLGAVAGGPVGEHWSVEVVGPGLPATAPLAFRYPASFPRLLVWAPGLPATPGAYTLTAASSAGVVVGSFTVGEPPWMPFPAAVVATAGAQGSARADWAAVAGARAYLVTAYDALTGDVATSQWVASTEASFPDGSFVPGRAYDVYVAATDADMVGGQVPAQVSVAESLFDFGSFVAR
jgi:hypothetical protein